MSNNPSATTTTVTLRLENDLAQRLDDLASELEGGNRSALARLALRRGLDAIEAGQRESQEPSEPLPRQKVEDLDLVVFANQVLDAARSSKTGKFGSDRVFVSHVWKKFKRDWKPKGMNLEAFKVRLIEANRARHLSLVCADMAPFLDQKDVQESEIRYLSATFHLLCI